MSAITNKPSDLQRFFYNVYGLVVESQIEFPGAKKINARASDVVVSLASTPKSIVNPINRTPWCIYSASEFLFWKGGVARFHITHGNQIAVDPQPVHGQVPNFDDIRVWLFGTAFGALIHQRGLLPLHVSAVETSSGIWAFTGESGEGKSTLAGFLYREMDWVLACDDVCVVDLIGEEAFVCPGSNHLKLCPDARQFLSLTNVIDEYGIAGREKTQLQLASSSRAEVGRLEALVVLESSLPGEKPSLQRLKGVDAFAACRAAVYRPTIAGLYKSPEARMAELSRLVSRIQTFRFRRPRSFTDFGSNLTPLLDAINSTRIAPPL